MEDRDQRAAENGANSGRQIIRLGSLWGFSDPMSAIDTGDASSRLKAWHENWVEAIASIARGVPGGLVYQSGDMTIVRSGLAISAFNCAFALDSPQTLSGIHDQIERILVRGTAPWTLVTTTASADAFDPIIRAFRLQHRATLPGMVWEPLPESVPPSPHELEIRHLREPDDVTIFARTMMEGFGVANDLMVPWAEGVVSTGLSQPVVQGCYLGVAEGRPVCTAVRFVTRDIAGIYLVSTIPEFRRRGLAAAMIRRAAIDGRKEGCRQSYLQSSEAGRSVYEKLGYHVVEEYHVWAPEPKVPP